MSKISNRWIVFILVLPFMNISLFKLEQVVPFAVTWSLLTSILAMCMFCLLARIDKFQLFLFLYSLVTVISSVANDTITVGIFYSIFLVLLFCIFVKHHIGNFYELIHGLYYLFSLAVVINLINMLILPDGIMVNFQDDPIYFLGGKNAIQMSVLPAISSVMLYGYYVNKKLKLVPIIVLIICIMNLYLSVSGTAIVLSILVVTFILLYRRLYLSFYTYFIVYIGLFFSVVILRLQENLFDDFVANVLNKDMTFTGRTYIWDTVLSYISQSWFLGLGRGNSVVFEHYNQLHEAHNGFLEIILSSGVIGWIFFIIILLLVGEQLDKHKHHIFSQILSFSIFAYLVLGLTESAFNRIEFWTILVISYNIDSIIKQNQRQDFFQKQPGNNNVISHDH